MTIGVGATATTQGMGDREVSDEVEGPAADVESGMEAGASCDVGGVAISGLTAVEVEGTSGNEMARFEVSGITCPGAALSTTAGIAAGVWTGLSISNT